MICIIMMHDLPPYIPLTVYCLSYKCPNDKSSTSETIYIMLKNGKEFIDRIDALTERNMVSMRSRASKLYQIPRMEDRMNDPRMVQNDRRKRTGAE